VPRVHAAKHMALALLAKLANGETTANSLAHPIVLMVCAARRMVPAQHVPAALFGEATVNLRAP